MVDCFIRVWWTTGRLGQGLDSSLTVAVESRLLDNLAPGLSSSPRSSCWLQPTGHRLSTTGLSLGWEEASEKKQTRKAFPSSSATEEACKVWTLKIPGNNQRARNKGGKPWPCFSLASLTGFVCRPGSWSSLLHYRLCFVIGSATFCTHFAHFAHCKTNVGKGDGAASVLKFPNKHVLSLSTRIAI